MQGTDFVGYLAESGFVKAKIERGYLDPLALDHQLRPMDTVVKKLAFVDAVFYVKVLKNQISNLCDFCLCDASDATFYHYLQVFVAVKVPQSQNFDG
ncbi:hypothetical protein Dsin_020422 [Dipteronia sinensis]|uniref:Uncharacterized protein n=1 Tax=Dipteronia sinensis TaxID=43782 RepID=A0AAE0A981_9ROSI|nr:hypothetical protein Dsin_020422 [Dipteronia sinensis]